MRISDWSSYVCSSDLGCSRRRCGARGWTRRASIRWRSARRSRWRRIRRRPRPPRCRANGGWRASIRPRCGRYLKVVAAPARSLTILHGWWGERAGAADGFSRAESENSNPAVRDQLPDHDDDGDDEQQMDVLVRDVAGEEAEQPPNEQNDGTDRKRTRLTSSHYNAPHMPSSTC